MAVHVGAGADTWVFHSWCLYGCESVCPVVHSHAGIVAHRHAVCVNASVCRALRICAYVFTCHFVSVTSICTVQGRQLGWGLHTQVKMYR